MEDAGYSKMVQHKINKHADSKNELASTIQLITTVATDMEEQHEYEGKSQAHVEDLVSKIVALQQRFEDEISALKLVENAILNEKVNDSTDWEAAFPGLLKQAQAHSAVALEKRQKDAIKKLKRTIAEVYNKELPEEEGGGDDDIKVVRAAASFICPLTQVELVDPYKNTLCGHCYSKTVIFNYVKNSERSCPVATCGKRVSKVTLERDVEMTAQLKRRKRARHQPATQQEEETVDLSQAPAR